MAIYCISGWAHEGTWFAPLESALAAASTVSLLSLQELVPEPTSEELSAYSEALQRRLQTKAVPPPHTLVGWSMGAMVALETAARRPELVERLVLLSSSACFTAADNGMAAKFLPVLRRQLREDFCAGIRVFFETALREGAGASNLEEELERRIQAATDMNHEALISALSYLENRDLSAELKLVECPALVLSGEDDGVVNTTASKNLAHGLPQGSFVSFSGRGHDLFHSQPGPVVKVIIDELGGLP